MSRHDVFLNQLVIKFDLENNTSSKRGSESETPWLLYQTNTDNQSTHCICACKMKRKKKSFKARCLQKTNEAQ